MSKGRGAVLYYSSDIVFFPPLMKFSGMKVRRKAGEMEQRKKACSKGVVNSGTGVNSKIMAVEGN